MKIQNLSRHQSRNSGPIWGNHNSVIGPLIMKKIVVLVFQLANDKYADS